MRRLSLVVLTAALVVLPGRAPAIAEDLPPVPVEAGTLQLAGLVTYDASTLTFHPATCVHTFVPGRAGYFCRFILSGSTSGDGLFTLEGVWTSGTRTYTMHFLLPSLVLEAGPHSATGTVSSGAKSGPATLTFVTSPHVDPGKSSFAGAIDYALT